MSKTQKKHEEVLTAERMNDIESAITNAVKQEVLSPAEATLMRSQLNSVIGLTGLQLMLFFTGAFILMPPQMAFAIYDTLKNVLKIKAQEAFEDDMFKEDTSEEEITNVEFEKVED